MSRHIVLVHGAAHTGECWELLEPELEARGFTVHAPTLGGHRGTPRDPAATSMRTYVEDVRTVLHDIGEPAALLGHSMGGFVVSGVAEQDATLVKHLIYLCAFVPRQFGEVSLTDAATVGPALQEAGDIDVNAGVVSFPAEVGKVVFYNRCSPEVQDRAVSHLCPQPIAVMTDSITTSPTGLGSVHKTYIECRDDHAVPLSSQREMQQYIPFGGIESIDSDHSPFYSMPAELAALIDGITAN